MDPPRPPRLLALNHTALVSGAEAVLLRVLEAASAEGWPVVVACPPGPLATSAVAAGLAHLPLPDLMLPAGPRPLALATLVVRHLRASRLVRRAAAGSDIVVANGIRVLPTLRLARLRVPVVWNAHNLVDLARWRRMVRVCGPAVDLVVSGSRAVVESLPEPRLASRVVRYGTPWPVAPAPAGPRLPLVVGCAAILTSWKGQDVLLDAIAHLGRPEVVVELLGGSFPKDGDYVNALHDRAGRADLAGRVRFTGHLDDALGAMRAWTVAVVASVDPEAGPLTMLEAMSIGVPAVATNHGGPLELLGEAGLLVPPGNPKALGGAIGRLLDDAELYRRCTEAGPRLVAAGLTLDAQVRGMLEVLQELVTAGRVRRGRLSRRHGR